MSKNFFWIDLEMTGLDDQLDSILEFAVVVTDTDLNSLEEYSQVVYQPQEVIDKMNDWCKKTHGETGLTDKIKDGKPLKQVEAEVIAILDKHFSGNKQVILCGNSVWNDRRFIDRYMPELAKRLHYRLIDVSSFKEIFRQKYGIRLDKKNSHKALEDIHESIDELKSYLSYFRIPEKK